MSRSVGPRVLGGCGALFLLIGCTHTGAGTPTTSHLRTALPSRPAGSAPPGALPSAAPSISTGTKADLPLCRDFLDAGGRLGNIRPGDEYAVRLWRKVAQDAPRQIKPDAETVANFVADAANGSPDGSRLASVRTSLRHVTDWVTRNCI